MLIGLAKLDLFFSEVHSLKEKRNLLRTVKEKTSQTFKIPIAEVGHQDLWQRAQIGFAIVGSDRALVQSLGEQVIDFIEKMDLGSLTEKAFELIDF